MIQDQIKFKITNSFMYTEMLTREIAHEPD